MKINVGIRHTKTSKTVIFNLFSVIRNKYSSESLVKPAEKLIILKPEHLYTYYKSFHTAYKDIAQNYSEPVN